MVEGALRRQPWTSSSRSSRTAATSRRSRTPLTTVTRVGMGPCYYGPKFSPDGTPDRVRVNHVVHPQCGRPSGLMSQRLDGTDRRTEAEPDQRERLLRRPGLAAGPGELLSAPQGRHAAAGARWWSAFPECTSPNKVHGPPLEHPSCGDSFNPGPPTSSQHLTVGTPDRNGAPAQFRRRSCGSACRLAIPPRRRTRPTSASRSRPPMCAAGRRPLRRPAARPTWWDRGLSSASCRHGWSCGSPTRTTRPPRAAREPPPRCDMPYSFTVPCTETPDNMIGSSCEVDTTADALDTGRDQGGRTGDLGAGPGRGARRRPGRRRRHAGRRDVFLRQGIFVPYAATRRARCRAARSSRPPRPRPRSPGSCPSRAR